jgi:LuxR family maltose regulon positive regulatory protein
VERLLALAGMPPLTAAERAAPATPAATTVAAAVAALQSGLLLDPLSAREQEILGLLAAGLSNHDIAERLVVAVSTVRWYTKQLYRKLDVHNRTQAVLRAQALGLV